ncbi:MAG: hypothetical protein FWD71_07490 [Oscillospiraceae bacterium]|nr:hypothetical protein [Oscillospiraceae bacterium]
MNNNVDSDKIKRLSSDFKINFENINKTNMIIAGELEKRFSFAEENAKILLSQSKNIDFSFFVNLIGAEKSKINFANIKKLIIDENVFLCEHIFKSINFGSLFLSYFTYIEENPEILNNYKNMFEAAGFTETDEVNLNIKLNEKLSLNSLIQYISLFDFKILLFYYDIAQNAVDISIDIAGVKDKMIIFAVFIDLLKYFGISEISVNL